MQLVHLQHHVTDKNLFLMCLDGMLISMKLTQILSICRSDIILIILSTEERRLLSREKNTSIFLIRSDQVKDWIVTSSLFNNNWIRFLYSCMSFSFIAVTRAHCASVREAVSTGRGRKLHLLSWFLTWNTCTAKGCGTWSQKVESNSVKVHTLNNMWSCIFTTFFLKAL